MPARAIGHDHFRALILKRYSSDEAAQGFLGDEYQSHYFTET